MTVTRILRESNDPTVPPLSLAIEIVAAHHQAQTAALSALEHARYAGDLLSQAKGALPHGHWLPWLAAHCPTVSPRVAQNYMRIASRWTELMAHAKRDSYLPLGEALRLLRTSSASVE